MIYFKTYFPKNLFVTKYKSYFFAQMELSFWNTEHSLLSKHKVCSVLDEM